MQPERSLHPVPPASDEPAATHLGALKQWQRELRAGVGGQIAGKPETYRRDTLYRAARCEFSADLCRAAGIHDAAQLLLEYAAARIVEDAHDVEAAA